MDDIIILHSDKEYLKYVMDEVSNYLWNNIHLLLNTNKSRIYRAKDGVEFLKMKYTIEENGRVNIGITNKSFNRTRRKFKTLINMYDNDKIYAADIDNAFFATKSHFELSNDKYKISEFNTIYNDFIFNHYVLKPIIEEDISNIYTIY